MVRRIVLIAAVAQGYIAPRGLAPRALRPLRVTTLEKEETAVAAATKETADRLVVDPAIEAAVDDLLNEECAVEEPEPECLDEEKMAETRACSRALAAVRRVDAGGDADAAEGEKLEAGWEKRGKSSSIRRNVEVWKALGGCALKVLKARKQGSEEKTAAATFARDKLLTLGPTFVKLGQDDVPAFSGARAKEIVARELGVADVSEVFSAFGDEPIAAASLGQVHLGTLKKTGQRVAVKVQRAGLKDLFATDLKNLRKLCELLDKLDPKSDGADRSYIDVFDESEKLLYLEIDYLNEARNADRFRADFAGAEGAQVRVPTMYYEFSTPRVLTMEYIDSFKLTDIDRVEKEGLDRADLAKRIADSFLYQIVDTAYFHCDPHPGNLCVDTAGNLVYYDFGMMDELKPNVKDGFKEFCRALRGGPMIGDIQLGVKAKQLVDAVETMGALTEAQVFRFPSTFTFIFRAVASIDGIGKGLDDKYDLGKFAQPFVERLVDRAKYGGDSTKKSLSIFSKATGLNAEDVNTALTSPKKIAYLEDTVRAIETGQLKIALAPRVIVG
ncbi:hypothetical protein JL720_13052 [Aureococcus anophagefferens]|nr:hypothetical protein JL720_13052 [Aureococcus anophagefferens]